MRLPSALKFTPYTSPGHPQRWHSDPVDGATGEDWETIDQALRSYCGLPGGSSLARLLQQARGAPDQRGRHRFQVTRRRQQAQQLRAKGLTMEKIGRRLGISRQAVHQLLGG
jgi:DNA-binding NarL/FixJ family response regulator